MSIPYARLAPLLGALATIGAAAFAPNVAHAQACSTADAAAGKCLLLPSPTDATPTASGVAAGTPATVYAKSVGGLAYFSGSLYAFAAAPDPTDPFATPNVLLGSKPRDGLLTTSDPWVMLPWNIVGGDPLHFGLLVNVIYDFDHPENVSPTWLFSGYGTSQYTRTDQLGRTSLAFSDVFGTAGPVGDQVNPQDPQSTRQPTPAEWMAANIVPPVGSTTSQTYFVGFEDSITNSDGDFNDFVLAVNVSSPTTTPEPGTLALLATGLAAVGTAARRRRR